MVVPSWIKHLKSVPKHFGEASAGTLKADEWRTLASLYLPIALTSLWGEGTYHSSTSTGERLREVLDNTMDLVQAVILICRRSITMSTITEFRKLIERYVRNLHEIHVDATPRTNLHMSLHLYIFLVLFGPVHGWWTFTFERLIGYLQHLPSNKKPGKANLVNCFGERNFLI
jgi:hypothetical protein